MAKRGFSHDVAHIIVNFFDFMVLLLFTSKLIYFEVLESFKIEKNA